MTTSVKLVGRPIELTVRASPPIVILLSADSAATTPIAPPRQGTILPVEELPTATGHADCQSGRDATPLDGRGQVCPFYDPVRANSLMELLLILPFLDNLPKLQAKKRCHLTQHR